MNNYDTCSYRANALPGVFSSKIFDDLFNVGFSSAAFDVKSKMPYDLYEVKDENGLTKEFRLVFALAGVDEKSIKVQAYPEKLKISAQYLKSTEEESLEILHSGICKQNLDTVFELSAKVDRMNIKRKLRNGLLTIIIPLKEEEVFEAKEI